MKITMSFEGSDELPKKSKPSVYLRDRGEREIFDRHPRGVKEEDVPFARNCTLGAYDI